jgi:hypothetical protein
MVSDGRKSDLIQSPTLKSDFHLTTSTVSHVEQAMRNVYNL